MLKWPMFLSNVQSICWNLRDRPGVNSEILTLVDGGEKNAIILG